VRGHAEGRGATREGNTQDARANHEALTSTNGVESMTQARDVTGSQFRKGVVELAILALLRGREAYGGELVDRLADYRGLSISAGTAYPLLSRLKKSGLIASVWRESPVGPPRKYYRLTDAGADVLEGMVETWSTVRDDLDHLLSSEDRDE